MDERKENINKLLKKVDEILNKENLAMRMVVVAKFLACSVHVAKVDKEHFAESVKEGILAFCKDFEEQSK